ncbi:ClpA/ClpB-like protein, partial [Nonomuraea fuscirosea]
GLDVSPDAKQLLADRGYDPVMGARPLRRTIQRELEDSLSEKILYGELRPGQVVKVTIEGEGDNAKFIFKGETSSKIPDSAAAIAAPIQN